MMPTALGPHPARLAARLLPTRTSQGAERHVVQMSLKTSRAAAMVASMSSSVCAVDMKPAS